MKLIFWNWKTVLKTCYIIVVSIYIIFIVAVFNEIYGPEKPKMYGTYMEKKEVVTKILELNNDGTFKQEILLNKTKKIYLSKGTWLYLNGNLRHSPTIVFENNFIDMERYNRKEAVIKKHDKFD